MKTVIIRNYEKFHDRTTDTKFEPRAVDIDGEGAGFVGVAVVDDAVAAEHYIGRHGFLVFNEDPRIMAGTARTPASASTASALTREPTDAELDHAEECRIDAERAQALRDGATLGLKPSKVSRKQQPAAESKAKADEIERLEAERVAAESKDT